PPSLPRPGRVVPGFQEFLRRFGSLDYLYVVFDAPADHTIDEYDDEIASFVEKLKKLPELERVDAGPFDAGRDFAYLGDRELLLLSPARLQEALSRFDAARMPAELQAQRELLTLPSPQIAQMVRQDPLGLFQLLRDQMQGAAAASSIDPTRHGYVTKDGRSRLVLVKPTRPPFDDEFTRQLFARLDTFTRELDAQKSSAAAKANAHAASTSGSGSPSGGARPGTPTHEEDTPPPLTGGIAPAPRIALDTTEARHGATPWDTAGSLAR